MQSPVGDQNMSKRPNDVQPEKQKREALTTSRSSSGQVCNYRSADGSSGMS